jgi:DNA-binding NarL/FixJ family response regulator
MKRVFIIEDDQEIRESYKLIINSSNRFAVLGDYRCCEDAYKDLIRLQPDIVLMDIVLPGTNGIEGAKYIKERLHYVDIIILTVLDDTDTIFEALKAGAVGYLSKTASYSEILSGLDEIVRGGAPMSTKIARKVVENYHLNMLSNPLGNRQSEVLSLLANGKTYTQISDELGISKETVKTHIRNIYKKLGVKKRSDAISIGRRDKIIY